MKGQAVAVIGPRPPPQAHVKEQSTSEALQYYEKQRIANKDRVAAVN